MWCKASFEMREPLIDALPDVLFVPPYVGPSGWIGIRLEGDVDWEMVAGLLEEGYRMVAPKRALAKLGDDPPS